MTCPAVSAGNAAIHVTTTSFIYGYCQIFLGSFFRQIFCAYRSHSPSTR